jgi:hypothetical protein
VEKRGRGRAQCAVNEKLPTGREEQVLSADNLRDFHGNVVHDDGKFVGWNVVAPPDDKIAEVATGNPFEQASCKIGEADGFIIGNAEAPVDSSGFIPPAGGIGRRAPFRRIDWLDVGLVWGQSGVGEIAAGATAWVDPSAISEPAPSPEEMIKATTLEIRAFIPCEIEPAEVFDGGLGIFRLAAVRIEILDAKDEGALCATGALVGAPKSERVAGVEVTGGGGGDAAAVHAVPRRLCDHGAGAKLQAELP